MSANEFFADLFAGNVGHAVKRLEDWFSGWPAPLKLFATKLLSKEGKILEGLVAVAVADIISGSLTTDAFVSAAKDVFGKLVEQNVTTFTLQDVFAQLNIAVSDSVAQATPKDEPHPDNAAGS